jgi:4-hydroxy-tetrahydrodipicolinate synthase
MNRDDSDARTTVLADTTLWAATPVPCRENSEIDDQALHAYARNLFARPVGGVVVHAHTGRGLHWSDAQRRSILDVWCAHRPVGKSIVVAVGAPRDATEFDHALKAACDMAVEAVEQGADALMIHPPTFLKGDEHIWQKCFVYHRVIAEAVPVPSILFYLYENAGGLSYPMDLLDDLLTLPAVMGVKVATLDSVMTFQDIAGLFRLHPGKTLITGEDRFLGYSFMTGARAALIGMASAFVEPQAELIRAWRQDEYAKFVKLNAIVDAFSRATFRAPMEGYIARMLACLVIEGAIPAESAHDPFGPGLKSGEFEELNVIARALRRRFEQVMSD